MNAEGPNVHRRLAAVLAADVVGYSRLMEVDEAGTLARLKTVRLELIDPAITKCKGRIIKTTGDGLLVEFQSVTEALRCAVEFQERMARRNRDMAASRALLYRIGINLGDVIVEDDDIFGDGVNVAARLEALAEPGGICISAAVRDQVADRLPVAFQDLGDQQVKNISRPIRVFKVTLDAQAGEPADVAGAQSSPRAGVRKPSIAVLPFVNMSGDKEQEYFSDGLTEELLNSLAELNELQVAARTSSFSFKGQNTDIALIARKLNVGAILEGSVRRSGDTVRITAQLINAVTGFHLWSKSYDRDIGDVLKLQTEIATSVASALRVRLLGDVAAKVELGGTRNPAAFDAYLRGLKLARIAAATTPMECQAPIDAFSEAITLDSNFALAYANRALIKSECAGNSTDWLQQPNEGTVHADAERAIALAPSLADGYVALSRLELGSLKLEAADQACARALALGPGNVRVLYDCSLLAVYLGHADTAISGARHGVALDPLNPLSHRALGDTLRYARRYEEAIAAYHASIAADPENAAEAYALRGLSYYLAGNLSLAQSSCEVRPDSFRNRVCRAVIYDRLGRHADAAAVLAKIKQQGGDAAAYQYAQIFTQWGDRKAALDWLEKAMRLRDPGLVYTKVDPLMDPLREEPRFQAVTRELRFPD